MPAHFSESQRILGSLRIGRALTYAVIGALLVGAWVVWLYSAQIKVWILSREARIESKREPFVVRASMPGILREVSVRLGQRVEKGEVLVRFDAREKEADLHEIDAQIAADLLRMAALQAKFESQVAVQSAEVRAARRAREKAELSQDEAERQAQYFAEKLERLQTLSQKGVASEDDVRQSLFDLERERNEAFTSQLEADLQRIAQTKASRSTSAKRHENEAERLELAAKLATSRARRERLLFELERYEVRSPLDGAIGEMRPLHPSLAVAAQEVLAVVVPEDQVRIVAYYSGSDAAGLLAAGQVARMRLSAFPWTQYGTVSAVVSQVSQPTRGADVRVEADVTAELSHDVRLTHGMVGTLETNVDELSPISLVLRSVGKWIEDQAPRLKPDNTVPAGGSSTSAGVTP